MAVLQAILTASHGKVELVWAHCETTGRYPSGKCWRAFFDRSPARAVQPGVSTTASLAWTASSYRHLYSCEPTQRSFLSRRCGFCHRSSWSCGSTSVGGLIELIQYRRGSDSRSWAAIMTDGDESLAIGSLRPGD